MYSITHFYLSNVILYLIMTNDDAYFETLHHLNICISTEMF